MSPPEIGLLLAWGLLVGLDLVSLPQVMIARPIVAAPVAGAILGDFETGLRVGLVLELFQLDVLPVGASRYPEYGTAAIAATATATMVPGILGLGLGVVIGLCTAALGGVSLHLLRRYNGRAIARAGPGLDAGKASVIVRTHLAALARDAARGALVTAVGLGLAWLAQGVGPDAFTLRGALLLAAATLGVAVAAGFGGALKLIASGMARGVFAVGLLAGLIVAVTR